METMTTSIIFPFLVFFPFLGAVISYIIGRSNKGARDIWCWILSAVIFIASLTLIGKETVYSLRGFCGLGLSFAADGFGVILAVLTGAIWLITTIFSKEYMAAERNRNRYYFFVFLTLGATMGIFLSADLFTTFIFFEIMSFTSFVLVMHDEEDFTVRSAKTYLAVAVIGGLVTLMGLFMMYQKAGTLNMAELTAFMQSRENPAEFYAIGVLILFGFAAKAGLFPLHIWLPNAYTVAPAPSSALLSCLLTKTGVCGTIIVSCKLFLHDAAWGQCILILVIITMVLGAVQAVFSVNLIRTLACSSMSQIGFIIIAIGMQGLLGEHNALAASGTLLHFLNHSLFKLLLFLGAGVIFMNLRELNLNKIRGYGKDKPLLKLIFLMPILGAGFALAPVWYLRATASVYKKHLNEELETAISVVTTSYLRSGDLMKAVKENIPYLNPPVKGNFEAFITEAEMLNANMISAINSLKMKIPNRIFHEWCNTLIQCQSDRNMMNTLTFTVQKFSDMRIFQTELEAIINEPKREAFAMMFLVLCNIPLLYVLNQNWFETLIFTLPGKITLAICAAVILFSFTRIMQLSKPIVNKG